MNTKMPFSASGCDVDGIPLGAHLSARRRAYRHHGVYVGKGEVIHFLRPSRTRPKGGVVLATLEEFTRGEFVCIESAGDVAYAGAAAVQRAHSRLGESGYSLLWNNCEHFSNWCVRGVARSEQVERLCMLPSRLTTELWQRMTELVAPAYRRSAGSRFAVNS